MRSGFQFFFIKRKKAYYGPKVRLVKKEVLFEAVPKNRCMRNRVPESNFGLTNESPHILLARSGLAAFFEFIHKT
jgi:hypothetical protein